MSCLPSHVAGAAVVGVVQLPATSPVSSAVPCAPSAAATAASRRCLQRQGAQVRHGLLCMSLQVSHCYFLCASHPVPALASKRCLHSFQEAKQGPMAAL